MLRIILRDSSDEPPILVEKKNIKVIMHQLLSKAMQLIHATSSGHLLFVSMMNIWVQLFKANDVVS